MQNFAMIQFFEWNIPNDGNHWKRLKEEAGHLAELGFGGLWIPPCAKASGQDSAGYDIYDLYDLGEFEQKGTIRTRYGTKDQLIEAINVLHEKGLKVYADVVLNHKAGADETELFSVVEVAKDNRQHDLSQPFDIRGWTKFDFQGRGEVYSSFKWNFVHFSGVDWDEEAQRGGIYRIVGDNKWWSDKVDSENRNYDYLMFANINLKDPNVVEELDNWAAWFVSELDLDGFRLDAIKHMDQDFIRHFIDEIRMKTEKEFFVVGEYWNADRNVLVDYLDDCGNNLELFDFALHYQFVEASRQGRDYDLTTIFQDCLVSVKDLNTVTFVDNHDTIREGGVEDWFKPLAYALILLRYDGYPCVFYGDYYGMQDQESEAGHQESLRRLLDLMLMARKEKAYGVQVDYFDHANVIGWIRKGDEDHLNSGLAVVISNGDEGYKTMSFGSQMEGVSFIDSCGLRSEVVTLNSEGTADFPVNGGSVSVWIRNDEDV